MEGNAYAWWFIFAMEGKALELDVKYGESASVISLKGDIDMYTSPDLRAGLIDAVSKTKKKLAVYLRDVTYIDSSGLAVLIDALKRCTEKSLDFFLVEPSKVVLDVVELALLSDIFTIKDNLDELG